MSHKDYVIKIVDDVSKFQERIDEILDNKLYEDVKHCVATIKERLKVDPEMVALCAPQVGDKLRLFVVKTSGNNIEKFKVFLNPMIVSSKGLHLSMESNPSFKDKWFIIPRKDEVHIAYQTIDGHIESETYKGVYGEVIQQMIEMLDGITLFDYGLDLDGIGGVEAFTSASNEDKIKVMQMYLDSLKSFDENLKKEIEASPELKNLNDTINFTTQMLLGNIKPIDKDGNVVEYKTPEEQMVDVLEKIPVKE